MTTLAFYLSRQFLARCLLVLAGTALFALSADLMENGANVLDRYESPWRALFEYTAVRLPGFVSDLLPMATLIAGLWTIGALHRHRELVAILGTGLSPAGLVRLALLGGLPLVILQFALDDWVVPRTVRDLAAWNVGVYDTAGPAQEGDWLWLYSGGDIVRLANPRGAPTTFSGVTIFRRDSSGQLVQRVDAPRARLAQPGLVLTGAVVRTVSDARTMSVPQYRWRGHIDLETVEMLSWEPEDLSLAQLSEVIENAGYGQRPTDVYRTWYHARLVSTLQPLLMLLLAMSLIPSYSRTGSFAWLFLVGMSIGFAAFVLTGITTAMGAANLLAPWLAAWAPVIALLALIARFILQHEFLTAGRRAGRRVA